MLEIMLTTTEAEIIERAFVLACSTGQMPDPKIQGDDVRIKALRDTLRKKVADFKATTWTGRMDLQRRSKELE